MQQEYRSPLVQQLADVINKIPPESLQYDPTRATLMEIMGKNAAQLIVTEAPGLLISIDENPELQEKIKEYIRLAYAAVVSAEAAEEVERELRAEEEARQVEEAAAALDAEERGEEPHA